MAGNIEQTQRANRRSAGLGLACVLGWTVAMTVLFFWPDTTLLHRLELRTLDWRFLMRGERAPQGDITIVSLDEESIKALGRWPWPRRLYGELARKLTAHGAKAVVFDVFLTDADTSPGGPQSDAALVRDTRELGLVYHSGYAYTAAREAPPLDPRVAARAWTRARLEAGHGLNAVATLFQAQALAMPLPELAAASRGVGVSNLPDPEDGTYRHLVPLVQFRQTLYPSVALVVAADALGVSQEQVTIVPGREIRLGDKTAIPLDVDGRMLINFLGGDRQFPYVSAAEVFAGTAPRDQLKGKLVFVGWTAQGINDLRASPFATVFNGVETEASAVDNILSGRYLRPVAPVVTGLLILATGLLLGLVLPRVSTLGMCAVGLGCAVGYPWLCVALFSRASIVLHLLCPTLTYAGALFIALTLRLATEERRRRQAHSVLRHFVPPQLVGRLMDEEALGTLSGERREITVFFADLRNFTATSEELAPEDTVAFLNRYFALMHEVIWEHEGTLDKYVGDEIMVFYNAPLSQDDHAARAVRTAIDMQRRIAANAAEWEWFGVQNLRAGIGIATGNAVVGYVGSGERMQYTVIGNTVNLASRLQAQCKPLGASILLDDPTYRQVSDLIEAENMGEVSIPGIALPVQVWHVLDYRRPEDRGNWGPVEGPARGGASRAGA